MKYQIQNLLETYQSIKPQIEQRLAEFQNIWKKDSEFDLYKELIFCQLTPQSNAERCWMAVQQLEKRNLLFSNDTIKISECLRGYTRFHHTKANHIIENRETLVKNNILCIRDQLNKVADPKNRRKWLVQNIKGMGYKEASHYLRNIGFGEEFAILDRHILKKLVEFEVIDSIPSSLSKKMYLEIETLMEIFSLQIEIPLSHLDFVFWYMQKKFIFK